MKRLFWFLFLLFIGGIINAQTINQNSAKQSVTEQANQMSNLYKSGDHKGYVRFIHPVIVQAAGGENKMIELLTAQDVQIQGKGVKINSIIFNSPSEIVKSKTELQCTISQQTELKPAKGRVITYTTLIAISIDNGKNWKFIDTAKMDIAAVRKLYPNLSSKITLPPKRRPTVYTM
ncbi:MAG TPA: hypothetical protein VGE40_03140 [Bacilli bacterium]